jgi:diguanylate cyclase (GGDEF)-like protein
MAASACRDQIRSADMIGRIGGEEFAVAMPNTRVDDALVLVERLREALAMAEFRVGEAIIRTTASIGLAQVQRTEDFASLYARTDAALYAAKAQGRNRVVVATDLAAAGTRAGRQA